LSPQAALTATQRALADKSTEMAQQASAHQQALTAAQDEAERMRQAMAEKFSKEKSQLLAGHAEVIEQANGRSEGDSDSAAINFEALIIHLSPASPPGTCCSRHFRPPFFLFTRDFRLCFP
jgi:hypothetical protein